MVVDKITSSVNIYQNTHGQWLWRIYDETGTVISHSIDAYQERSDAENNLRITMTAIIDESIKALMSSQTVRMRPVVLGLAEGAAKALKALKDTGILDIHGNLTKKGRMMYNAEIEEELRRARSKSEQSMALPEIEASPVINIPVVDNDKAQNVTVRTQ